ncbi:MAG: phage holin family protein [Candidatus Cloacimonetes bacterium]|nr:phage holin family protein [Candidatus Cloacimonadota bacterium]
MSQFLVKILILSLAIYLVGRITKLYKVENFFTAFIVAIILSIVNFVIRPIFIVLTLPITILTLGVFLLFVNGFMLIIVSAIVPKFKVKGCLSSSIASLFISLCTMFIEWLI